MAYGRIASQDVIGTASANSVSQSYPATTTPGNLLIATVFANGLGLGSISIPGWTVAVTSSFLSGADATAILFKIADGTESNISASCSGATNMVLAIHEFPTGRLQAAQAYLDQTNSANTISTVTTLGVGSITPSKPLSLIIMVMSFPTGSTSGWSFDSGGVMMSSNGNLMDGYIVGQGIASLNPSASWSGLSTANGAIASFLSGSTSDSLYSHLLVGDGMSRSEVAN